MYETLGLGSSTTYINFEFVANFVTAFCIYTLTFSFNIFE
jgi:hypothetical protein